MTSNDDDTDDAPTSAGAGPGDETTGVPPPTKAARELAWSVAANATMGILGNGSFFGNILENWPLGSFVAVDATGFFGATFPVLTGLSYNFNGLDFSWPGTSLFGPIVPNVSWNPTP